MDFKDIKAVLDSTGVDVTVDRFIPIYRRKFGETHGTWAVECTEPSIAFVKVCKDKEEAERIARSLNALKSEEEGADYEQKMEQWYEQEMNRQFEEEMQRLQPELYEDT